MYYDYQEDTKAQRMQTIDRSPLSHFPLYRLKLQHQIVLSHHNSRKVLYRRHSLTAHLQARVPARIEVGEGQAFGLGPPGDVGGILRD